LTDLISFLLKIELGELSFILKKEASFTRASKKIVLAIRVRFLLKYFLPTSYKKNQHADGNIPTCLRPTKI
jgi:hypothetical protein